MRMDAGSLAVSFENVCFAYSHGGAEALSSVTLHVPRGGRLVLVGSNGAGKTTLLRLLGGKRRPTGGRALVLGQPAFETTALALDVVLVTDEWDPEFVSSVPTRRLLESAATFGSSIRSDSQRAARLLVALGIDAGILSSELMSLSTGQRRRVQLLCALLPPRALIILDEATNTLDVRSRSALLSFLTEECECRGATVVLCTHIFDGIDGWATHVAQLEHGRMLRSLEATSLPQGISLYTSVKLWLEQTAEERSAAIAEAEQLTAGLLLPQPTDGQWGASSSERMVELKESVQEAAAPKAVIPATAGSSAAASSVAAASSLAAASTAPASSITPSAPVAAPVPISSAPSADLSTLAPAARIMIGPIQRALEQLSLTVNGCSSALGVADLTQLESKAKDLTQLMEGTTRALDAFLAASKKQVPSKRPAEAGVPEGWGDRHRSEEELVREGVILLQKVPPGA